MGCLGSWTNNGVAATPLSSDTGSCLDLGVLPVFYTWAGRASPQHAADPGQGGPGRELDGHLRFGTGDGEQDMTIDWPVTTDLTRTLAVNWVAHWRAKDSNSTGYRRLMNGLVGSSRQVKMQRGHNLSYNLQPRCAAGGS
jgi:hypothetical protein